MKTLYFLTALILCFGEITSQTYKDSLNGFNTAQVVTEAHLRNFYGSEFKVFLKTKEREFINNKYHISSFVSLNNIPVSKYSSGLVNVAPCQDEGFESMPVGVMTGSSSGWGASQAPFTVSGICSASATSYGSNTGAVLVHTMVVADPNFPSGIWTSPFFGNKIVSLNSSANARAKISMTFPVTNSNWVFNYAYMGYLNGGVHACCDEAYIAFNFYNCTNALIPSLSRTIMATSTCVTTSTLGWVTTNSVGVIRTPNWITVSENLSAYIGSCVKVEVIASQCVAGGHAGYCYFDAECSGTSILANGTIPPANTYTSCANTATLSGGPGFSNYSWYGPSGSGITGATSSVVVANTSGVYTLMTSMGTSAFTQTLNLTVNPSNAGISISGSNSLCIGTTLTLQALGNGYSNYIWNNTPGASSIAISPTATAVYSVAATATNGCISYDSKTVTVYQNPSVSIIGGGTPICPGQAVSLFAAANAVISYSWNNGATVPNIYVSPSVTTAYMVSVKNAAGCLTSATHTVNVKPTPQFQLLSSSPGICAGQSATLYVSDNGNTGYSWSNGASTQTIIVSPSSTSVYMVTVTNTAGCTASASKTVIIYPSPQIQIISSNSDICFGQLVNFMVIGSNIGSIYWSTGQNTQTISVAPFFSAVYTATVNSVQGCVSIDSKSVTVHALPQINISAPKTDICEGESVNILASGNGIITYSWSNGSSNPAIVVNPSSSTYYNVSATDNWGCSSNSGVLISVDPCTDISELKHSKNSIKVFPNPTNDVFTMRAAKNIKGVLVNALGQNVGEINLSAENNYTQTFSGLASGVYFAGTNNEYTKIIVK
jgi:hypothetical protein